MPHKLTDLHTFSHFFMSLCDLERTPQCANLLLFPGLLLCQDARLKHQMASIFLTKEMTMVLLTANVGLVPSILLSTLAKSLVVACLINHCEMILFWHSFCRVLLVSWSLLGGLMRTALQSKVCFRKPQMGNKLVNYFEGDEGISFQCDLEIKKMFVFLGKGGGVRGRQRRETCFLKIKSALSSPVLS